MDAFVFWTQHMAPPALEIVGTVLGDKIRLRQTGMYKGHHLIRVAYEKDFDIATVEPQFRGALDAIEWQFVTTGESLELRDGLFPSFGIAPIIRQTVAVAYHATRV